MKIILVLALCALVFAQAPPRPQVSETFRARINFQFQNGTTIHENGEGDEARSEATNSAVLHAEFFNERPPFFFFDLARFDLSTNYFLDNHNWTVCHNDTLTGTLPLLWSWVASATYDGSRPYRNREVTQIWNATTSYPPYTVRQTAGFRSNGNATAATVPIFRSQETRNGNTLVNRIEVEYLDFNTTVPADFFTVPKQCGGTMAKYFWW